MNDVENTSHFFRDGTTPGQPSQYDRFEDGLTGAERSASAAPLFHPGRKTQRQRRIADLVHLVLGGMPDKYRDLLMARWFEGMSVEALGDRLGVSHQAISARLKTANRAFSKVMAECSLSLVA